MPSMIQQPAYLIPGTPSAFSANAIPFIGTDGILQQNTSKLYWDFTNNYLGIGTGTPSWSLDVVHPTPVMRVSNGTQAFGFITYGASISSNDWLVGNNAGSFIWYKGYFGLSTELMRLSNTGQLGIGVSPTVALDVVGSSRFNTNNGAAWNIDCSGNSGVVINNGANYALAAGSGLIVVTDPGSGNTAIYICGGGGVSLVLSTGAVWVASTTTPAAGSASIAYSGTAYAIYNNKGSALTVYIANMRTRPAN